MSTLWLSNAQEYYVDATLGSDSNSGRSAYQPWKTIAKVNAATFQPGDQILFKRGETWAEMLTPPSSGDTQKYVYFGAYGSGDIPVINGSALNHSLNIPGATVHHLEFHDIKFAGATGASRETCRIFSHDVLMEDCEITGSAAHLGYGGWSNDGSNTYNLIVRRCEIYGNAKSGIYIGSQTGTGGPHDCLIEDCTVHHNGTSNSADHGIYVAFGVTVRCNTTYSNKSAGLKFNNLSIASSPYTSVLSENLSYGNRWGLYAGAPDALVQNNVLLNNYQDSIYLDIDALDNQFYNNTLVNGATEAGLFFGADVVNAHNIFKNNIIFQNTVVVGARVCVNTAGTIAHVAEYNTFNNNLYYFNGNPATAIFGANTFAQWQALTGSPDANGILDDPDFIAGITTYSTTVDADSASGQKVLNVASTTDFLPNYVVKINEGGARSEERRIDTVQAGISLTLITNLANTHTAAQADAVINRVYSDLHIQSTSPCIGAGDNTLGVTIDKDGVSRGAAVDIGAYEYEA